MSNPLLNIEGLNIHFDTEAGSYHALKNVSFTVNRGEIVAVVGESGSGKSVTALSVLRLLPTPPANYTSGRILFSQDGMLSEDILKCEEDTLRDIRGNRISMIFQEPMTSLNPLMTCGKQVMESIRLHLRMNDHEAKIKTVRLFEKVRLPDPAGILDRYPHQLSGGQKQRVMIAMAMACEPALLIADEPTTALDVTVQKTILELIRDLQRQENMGVIFITHDLGLVAEIADRVVVMYKGEIAEQGNIRNILESPAHPYTRALLACRPVLHPRGSRLPVVSDFMENPDMETGTKRSEYEVENTRALEKGKNDDIKNYPGQIKPDREVSSNRYGIQNPSLCKSGISGSGFPERRIFSEGLSSIQKPLTGSALIFMKGKHSDWWANRDVAKPRWEEHSFTW